MTAEEIRDFARQNADLANRNEPGAYEKATVTLLGEIAAQIAESNARADADRREGAFVSSILDMLGAPAKEDGVALSLDQRIGRLQEKINGAKA